MSQTITEISTLPASQTQTIHCDDIILCDTNNSQMTKVDNKSISITNYDCIISVKDCHNLSSGIGASTYISFLDTG